MRPYYLALFIIFSSNLTSAQVIDSTENNKFKDTATAKPLIKKHNAISLSMPYRIVKDLGQSPLTYQRFTYQVAKYNERYRKNAITKLELLINLGFLRTNKKEVSARTEAPMLMLEINYQYLYRLGYLFNKKSELHIGGIFSNTLDGRLYTSLINNTFGYEFSNSFNPAFQFTYNGTTGQYNRKYQFGIKGNTSLLAHVIRPNFIGMEPYQAYEGEDINIPALFINGNTLALPNRFFRINTELYFDRFELSNNNKIRFFYGWGFHYTNLKQSNQLYSAYHNLGIVIMAFSEKTKSSIFKRKIQQVK